MAHMSQVMRTLISREDQIAFREVYITALAYFGIRKRSTRAIPADGRSGE